MELKETIIVNQLGYRTEDYKVAYMLTGSGQYQIIDVKSKQMVWQGMSSPEVYDHKVKANISKLNFTALNIEGEYIIQGNDTQSLPFSISYNNYNDVHKAVFKAFYFFRCGIKLEETFAGQWGHGACHTNPAIIYDEPTKTIDANGGWHDAGDYGKYIVAAGKAVADLLLAYECYPEAFKWKTPLPETDETMDDLLHEVKFELEWMLKMQNKQHGGVYHKLTTLNFPPLNIMPEDDQADLYALPISSTATASFAATLAMAARVYKRYDIQFSETCLNAALLAWDWLTHNDDMLLFKNPDNVNTGEYGDITDRDERYWAAAELYRATGHSIFHDAFISLANNEQFNKFALGWADMGGYGTISYLMCEHHTDAALKTCLIEALRAYANQLCERSDHDGFGISLEESQYGWGSNMSVLNHAMLLLIAQRIESHDRYTAYVVAHLHYILGANINRYSFISGFGARAMTYPHHRPSVADNVVAPVPGLVSGGPNRNLQDDCAKQYCAGAASAACFIDHEDSYSTNEVTIYWNSPALFVISAFVS